MTWWEDTWLQESFADYLGFRVAEEAAGIEGTFVDFTIGWKPWAYVADERGSTHPVAPRPEDVPDVASAEGNFDALSYAKGNSVLRQLCTWLGDDAFIAGVNAYLSRHAWGNATLSDFVAALDSATDRNVVDWVAGWLQTTGFDTLRVTRESGTPVLVREGSRQHRVRITTYDATLAETGTGFVDLADAAVPVPDAAVVLPNAGGETYARIRLDPQSWTALTSRLGSLGDPAARAIVWTTAFDLARCAEITMDELLDLVRSALPGERHASIAETVIDWGRRVFLPLLVPPDRAAGAVATFADACTKGLAGRPTPEVAVALTRGLAATSADAGLLSAWLADGRTPTGPMDPALTWVTIHRLAALGAADAAFIADAAGTDGTIVGVLGAARAAAARPTDEAKRSAWSQMFDDPAVSNRMFAALAEGFWNVEQAGLLEPWIVRYAVEVPPLTRQRGPGFSQMVGDGFPRLSLDERQLASFEEALAGELPTVVRRAWQDRVDDARRALG